MRSDGRTSTPRPGRDCPMLSRCSQVCKAAEVASGGVEGRLGQGMCSQTLCVAPCQPGPERDVPIVPTRGQWAQNPTYTHPHHSISLPRRKPRIVPRIVHQCTNSTDVVPHSNSIAFQLSSNSFEARMVQAPRSIVAGLGRGGSDCPLHAPGPKTFPNF